MEERRYHWRIKERPYPRPRSANVTRTPIRYCASRRHFANRSLLSRYFSLFSLIFPKILLSTDTAKNSVLYLFVFMRNHSSIYTLCGTIVIISHLFLISYTFLARQIVILIFDIDFVIDFSIRPFNNHS